MRTPGSVGWLHPNSLRSRRSFHFLEISERRRVPAARCEPLKNRVFRGRLLEMERLRIELRGERRDLLFGRKLKRNSRQLMLKAEL